MDYLAVGTPIKTYENEEVGWLSGKISKWDSSRKVYLVQYDNSQRIQEYNEGTILEPVLIANLGKGSKISIYSYSDNSFYDAEIKEVDDTKLDNFRADFDSGMSEWIDIRRYKYYILNAPNGKVMKTHVDVNLSTIAEKAPARRSATPEAVDSQDQITRADARKAKMPRDHPFPNVRNITGPTPTDIAFVDRGTVIAIRWKRPYILYDATVVKMKEDGSQYLLQYHYDSCTKWMDLRKSEFYVIGVDSNFNASMEEGPSATRATRRGARKSDGPATEEPSRKRRRMAASADEPEPETTETAIQTVNEREMSGFQIEAVQQLSVGSRVAIWSRHKEYRKATVRSFSKGRDEFEIQYDTEKHTRKINLKQNPFLVLRPVDGSESPPVNLPPALTNHKNPDVSNVGVGTRVSILWEADSKFYPGTVTAMREDDEPFYLKYDDGDEEWIDLASCTFKIEADGSAT